MEFFTEVLFSHGRLEESSRSADIRVGSFWRDRGGKQSLQPFGQAVNVSFRLSRRRHHWQTNPHCLIRATDRDAGCVFIGTGTTK